MILQFLGDSFCVSFGRHKNMGYFNSISSLLQDGSTYLNVILWTCLLKVRIFNVWTTSLGKTGVQQVTCGSLRPSLWSESPKNHTCDPTSQLISSTQDLTFVSFSLLDLGTLFITQHMARANCCESGKKSCGKWLQKWCQVLQACLIFKRSSFQIWKKTYIKKCLVFLPFSEEIHQKLALQVLQDALALRDERFSAPSIPSPKISQGFWVLWSVSCVTYRWHPSQTRMR